MNIKIPENLWQEYWQMKEEGRRRTQEKKPLFKT